MAEKYIGCGDSSCVIEKPKGMATNGGCRCFTARGDFDTKHRHRLQRSHYRMLARIEQLEKERDELRDAIAAIVTDSVWVGRDLDGADVQEMLEKRGLLVEVPASDEIREEFECDTMLALRWSEAALQQQSEETD